MLQGEVVPLRAQTKYRTLPEVDYMVTGGFAFWELTRVMRMMKHREEVWLFCIWRFKISNQSKSCRAFASIEL
jgi:hypothetical protein